MCATEQPDRAVFARDQRLRLNHTGVVDHIGQQASRRLRGQQHLAAIGANHAAVVHQRIQCTLIYRDVEQLVARHVQRDSLTSRQRDGAQLGGNHALVADVRSQQGNIAAIGCVDRALVQHRARTRTRELVVVRHEVGIGDGQGGCHQPAHVHRCTRPEQDAIGVDQEHLAVGRQAAQYVGGI